MCNLINSCELCHILPISCWIFCDFWGILGEIGPAAVWLSLQNGKKGRAAHFGAARETTVYVRLRSVRSASFSPDRDGSTAAAGQDQECDDNDPDAVVVIKKVAEAVIHGSSSVSKSMRDGCFRSQYHSMSAGGKCA